MRRPVRRLVQAFLIVSLAFATIAAVPFVHGGASTSAANDITKIKHVVIIMEENRSFDEYFGTFPGATGLPMKNGVPTVCIPDPHSGTCVKPYHDSSDQDVGGPHLYGSAVQDIDGGKMDGFITSAETGPGHGCLPGGPTCGDMIHSDVMGYKTGSDIPNYWAYAQSFVLQDRLFSSVNSWSLPNHLALTSGWAATCSQPNDPTSCVSAPNMPVPSGNTKPNYAWTDITYLLHKYNVSWKYYFENGPGLNGTPSIWNAVPSFTTVQQDGETGNVQPLAQFATDLKTNALPAVSWISPSVNDSDHPAALVSQAQSFVTGLINQIMLSPEWSSTAIFVAWDDWGGFYDHMRPVPIDRNGFGMRVPAFMVSPYARKGFVDHQTLSFDAYLKFIEDDFINGQRIDPRTDGRPDGRPDVRESNPNLGNLLAEFDFTQAPRAPMILPVQPKTTLIPPPTKKIARPRILLTGV